MKFIANSGFQVQVTENFVATFIYFSDSFRVYICRAGVGLVSRVCSVMTRGWKFQVVGLQSVLNKKRWQTFYGKKAFLSAVVETCGFCAPGHVPAAALPPDSRIPIGPAFSWFRFWLLNG